MASLVDDLVAAGLAEPDNGPKVAFDSWTDAVRRSVLRFHFDCDRPGTFTGSLSSRSLAGVSFISMECGKHAAYRDSATISPADAGYYLMTLQMSGEFRLSQEGRTAVLRPGAFAIYDSSKPTEITSSDDYKSVCVRFPKTRIGAARSHDPLAEITATPFECGPGLSSAVWTMVLGLNRNLESLGSSGPLAIRTMMELVTAMLRSELGQPDLGATGQHGALLARIHEYIDAQLANPGLSPRTIAAAHYISPRHLHHLFERTDHTVAAWIRNRRIEMAQRDLADPRMADVPVAAIAARRGFRDSSHFGQVFKRETGLTPAEYRRAALAARRRE
ncbi:AraC-like DNA-binding protein [Lipingzhangella halophila]|uniref:AraC-like DNA-binding protein n=1 Tax=Lipingzhangella halophila TaxID=1783352 RepID=A0A7W7RM63_9ACTN|nr:helix-turn-helix domain-containing protein [Lipingzhangella halophila]MBB4934524.1 AraC-like DNA-binding protein [Lipingzhangella halophila]